MYSARFSSDTEPAGHPRSDDRHPVRLLLPIGSGPPPARAQAPGTLSTASLGWLQRPSGLSPPPDPAPARPAPSTRTGPRSPVGCGSGPAEAAKWGGRGRPAATAMCGSAAAPPPCLLPPPPPRPPPRAAQPHGRPPAAGQGRSSTTRPGSPPLRLPRPHRRRRRKGCLGGQSPRCCRGGCRHRRHGFGSSRRSLGLGGSDSR